jgi:AraC-like DNA-binding protein
MFSANYPDKYRLYDLRRYCLRILRVLEPITLAGRRLKIRDLHPHLLSPQYTVREHIHSYYEGHIVLEGAAEYMQGTPQKLQPGSALLHAPHMPHTWRTGKSSCLRLLFWVNIDPVAPVLQGKLLPIWPGMLQEISLLLDDVSEARVGWQDRAMARTSVIISSLLSLADLPAIPLIETGQGMTVVETVEQYFYDNMARPISLSDIAHNAGLSVRSLCRQFHNESGVTVMERLNSFRMSQAAKLLSDTNLTLSEIALQVGLPEPSYFCRCFRKHFHTSPMKFKTQMSETR